jgi:hypothetical protein
LRKVRSYGLASATSHTGLEKARSLLTPSTPSTAPAAELALEASPPTAVSDLPLCPSCRIGHLLFVQSIRPQRKYPP